MRTVEVGRPKGEREFLKYLLKQKLRARVLGRFLPKVVLDAAAERVVSLLQPARGPEPVPRT